MRHRNGAERRDYEQLWTHRGNKFVIGTLHGDSIEIIAQYNPKELARQAAATWETHPNTSAKHSPTGEGNMWSEYKTTAPRTLTFELLFDGYEEGISVTPIVESLERLTIPVDMHSRDATKRRPQLCVAVWGAQQLRCVVQSVATKLTMFDESGEPLRASCTVVLSEVDVAAMMKVDEGAVKKISQKGGGYVHHMRAHSQSPYPPEDLKPTRVPPPNRSQSTPPPNASPSAKPAAKPAPPRPAAAASAPAAAASRDETPDEVAADEKRAGQRSDAEGANYQRGTPSTSFDGSNLDSPPQQPPQPQAQPAQPQPERDETPEEVAADEKRAGERSDAEGADYQRGTPSTAFDGSNLDSPPQQPPPDAVSGADAESPDAKRMAVYKTLE
jgi:hypothetical protein